MDGLVIAGDVGLNALAGIDGFWTDVGLVHHRSNGEVLMPLRALMGFGLILRGQ